jgi:hypothetical protein
LNDKFFVTDIVALFLGFRKRYSFSSAPAFTTPASFPARSERCGKKLA